MKEEINKCIPKASLNGNLTFTIGIEIAHLPFLVHSEPEGVVAVHRRIALCRLHGSSPFLSILER